MAVQMQADDRAVGHDGAGHHAGRLGGSEEGEPVLHDAVQSKHTWTDRKRKSQEVFKVKLAVLNVAKYATTLHVILPYLQMKE